jgi:hypothetical protein
MGNSRVRIKKPQMIQNYLVSDFLDSRTYSGDIASRQKQRAHPNSRLR